MPILRSHLLKDLGLSVNGDGDAGGSFFSFNGIQTPVDRMKVEYADHWSIAQVHSQVACKISILKRWKTVFGHKIKSSLGGSTLFGVDFEKV